MPNKLTAKEIMAKNLKRYLKSKGKTQTDLAKDLNIPEMTVSNWVNAKTYPRVDKIELMANYFGIYRSDLEEEVGRSQREKSKPLEDSAEYVAHSPVEEIVPVPIVGKISCGDGVLTYENIEGYEHIPRSWMNGGTYFFLRAHGDSMQGFRIEDNDLLLIREQPEVENGEIAAVDINGEAVLKRVTKSGNSLILESGNPKYPPRIVDVADSECTILGKLKKVILNF